MEHRWCKRWGLVLDVQLTTPCGTECVASTWNVSMDGMFVGDPPDSLYATKLVYVQLPLAAGLRPLKALVVHSSEQGVGLMFCAIQNKDRHLLARYLTEINQQSGE